MGLSINLEFDAAALAAPTAFRTAVQQAASMLDAAISNPITLNIQVQYGEGIDPTSAEGGPNSGALANYPTVRADLITDAAPGDLNFSALPVGSSIQGQSQVVVWDAEEKLFGMLPASGPEVDGVVDFGSSIPQNLLTGVALHEITHAMGRAPYGPQPDIFDLFRFSSPGNRLFGEAIPSQAAYFSVDGGKTDLADYGQYSDPSDFLNSSASALTPTDAFDEYYNSNTLQTLTQTDLTQLDVLGFNTSASRLNATASLFGSFVQNFSGPDGEVYALYEGLLDRSPDPLGFEDWIAAVQGGQSLNSAAQGFLSSPEYASKFGGYAQTTNAQYITDLYETALHRQPDSAGLQAYEKLLVNGTPREQVALDIALSPEAESDLQLLLNSGVFAPSPTDSEIARLYYGLLDRAPDATGLAQWEALVANGTSLTTVAESFLSSTEYESVHGNQSDSQFLVALYQGGLGRTADSDEVQFWSSQMQSGMSRATVALDVTDSPEGQQHLFASIEVGMKLA
jgi:hypothetical protein